MKGAMKRGSEVNFGQVAVAQRSTMKQSLVYQGTASAVPKRHECEGLQPLRIGRGLKPAENEPAAARPKPCSATSRSTLEFCVRQIAVLFVASMTAGLLVAQTPDVNSIMSQVGINQAKSQERRAEWIYQQKQTLRMVRSGGKIAREEHREYLVLPKGRGVEKQLTKFDGRYAQHGTYHTYDKPGFHYKGLDLDGDLISQMSDDMTNEKESNDGIGSDFFPLTYHEQLKYHFHLVSGLEDYRGHRVWRVAFEPKHASFFDDDEPGNAMWKGEALVDAQEFQPVAITTSMAAKLPAAVRILLGTNIKGLGFSLSYQKVADGIWFPVSYGGEFEVTGLFLYKRTMSIPLVNTNFRHTDVSSQIAYSKDEQ